MSALKKSQNKDKEIFYQEVGNNPFHAFIISQNP